MVQELREMLREASSRPPRDVGDLAAVISGGRRRVRTRRLLAIGGTTLAAGALTLGSVAWMNPSPPDLAATGVPLPKGPVMGLGDAQPAVEGTDYRVLTSYTNDNLNRANGQYLDGVTDDGLVLFRDGPHGIENASRFALLDPATGEKTWLDSPPEPSAQFVPLALYKDRLALARLSTTGLEGAATVDIYDRTSGSWSTLTWPSLPDAADIWGSRIGPDGRLYLLVPATQGQVPEGGWPMGPGGEADDSDAEGETFDLWSVSLESPTDVRDEALRVGAIAFTDDSLVWSDSSNGAAGMVHVRDLATRNETSFDPQNGEKCNLLSFGAAGNRIMMSQYCGTYAGGVRDDRVQVLSTDGDLITTVQGNGLEGASAGPDNDLVTITSHDRAQGGTYIYNLTDDTLLRLSEAVSNFGVGGPAPVGEFMWHTPVNRRNGAMQWVGTLLN